MENSKIIKINESTIKNIVRESIKNFIKESCTQEDFYRIANDLASFLYKGGVKVSLKREGDNYAVLVKGNAEEAKRLIDSYSMENGVKCDVNYIGDEMVIHPIC